MGQYILGLSMKNVVLGWFWPTLTFGWSWAFWSIWPKMTFWVLQCLNRLCHVNLDISAVLWKKVNIFGIFEVRHANLGWIKYGIYSCPFFIWHLDCKERCWIKNIILHFFAPKLRATTTAHGLRPVLLWWRLSCCSWSKKNLFWLGSLVSGKNFLSFLFLFF